MSTINDQRIQQKVDEVKTRFEERIVQIQKDGAERINRITDDTPEPGAMGAVIDLIFDVKWKVTSIKFDIPKFSMERETIKFDVPEVKMELKSIKFDVPATRMVKKCIAKKPEFYCKGLKCTVKYTCIYADIPEPYMKTIEIKTDIPKFTSKRMEIKFDKPVVKMETTEIKLHLPQFFLKELSAELKEQEKDIERESQVMTSQIAQAEMEMKISMESEIAKELDMIYDEIRGQLLKERENVAGNYDGAIAQTKAAIKTLKENNAVDEVTRLEAELSKLVQDYSALLAEIDRSIEALNQQETEALQGMKIAA